MIVYKLNFSNSDKVYIGITSRVLGARVKQHRQMLQRGEHHSTKLQKDWPSCGEISAEVLSSSAGSLEELKQQEVACISKYDSYHNGYNSTLGGDNYGFGHTHNTAKLLEDDYRCIVAFAALTDLNCKEIAKELGISVHIVTDIVCQVNHTHLKHEMPVEYSLMVSKKRQGQSNIKKGGWPSLLCPKGIIHTFINANEFAKLNGLCSSHLHSVLTGKRKTHLGWRLADVSN